MKVWNTMSLMNFKSIWSNPTIVIIAVLLNLFMLTPIHSELTVDESTANFLYLNTSQEKPLWEMKNSFVVLMAKFLALDNDPDLKSGISLLSVNPAVKGTPLFYPNPFRQHEMVELGYHLSKNLDIEIRIYDMRAIEVYKKFFPAGTNGGFGEPFYNRIQFFPSDFGFPLSSGVYVFLLINDSNVLAKGKFAVIP